MTMITLKDIVKAKPGKSVAQDQKSIFLISNYSHKNNITLLQISSDLY